MNITRMNYELYFLDYFEGTLSEEGKEELMRFLELHPDLKEEFDAFDMVRIPCDGEVHFPAKGALKKSPGKEPGHRVSMAVGGTTDSLDDMFVSDPETGAVTVSAEHYEMAFAAYAEGDLTPGERQAVEAFAAADPAIARELETMGKMKLPVDESVVYPYKRQARRRRTLITWQHVEYAAVAATIALLLVGTFTLFPLREHEGVALEQPVDRSGEHPEAVTDAPVLQQADVLPVPSIVPEHIPEDVWTAAVPELQAAHNGQHGRFALHLALTEEEVPVFHDVRSELPHGPAQRISPVAVAALPGGSRPVPDRMDKRKEYLWLAYRDRSEVLALLDVDRADAEDDRPVGLLAGLGLENSARERLRQIEDVIETEGNSLLEKASRGVSGISELLKEPLSADRQDPAPGRRPVFSIGNFIEVSRTVSE